MRACWQPVIGAMIRQVALLCRLCECLAPCGIMFEEIDKAPIMVKTRIFACYLQP